MRLRVPEWCERGRGEGPLLLVAPHGGRRPPVNALAPPANLRVNDLYTPEVTRVLAEDLRAGFIVNRGVDRNVLDLNRISQVRRHAAWFLQLLLEGMTSIIEHHGYVELVFIHGWNTGRPRCDIGLGGKETATQLQVADGAWLTASPRYWQTRIAALRAACRGAQIHASVGEKYPASHRNNLLQLFTPRARELDDPAARRIASWVAAGQVNAVQLELSIPLRWPGVWRERFRGAMRAAFGRPSGIFPERVKPRVPGVHQDIPKRLPEADSPPADGQPRSDDLGKASLQIYDPGADVGLFASVGRLGPAAVGGRLLLFLGGQRVALFTGEEPAARGRHVLPLQFCGEADLLELRFCGPMLLLDDAAVYLDLEAALAQSRLVDAEIRLRCRMRVHAAAGRARFGWVRGEITVAGQRMQIDAGGFSDAASLRATGAQRQTMLAAAFDADHALLSRVVDGVSGGNAVHFAQGVARSFADVRIAVSTNGDPDVPAGFALTTANQPPLRGEPLSRMAILRPIGRGTYLRVTFGTGRFDWNGREGWGLYEYAQPVRAAGMVASEAPPHVATS